MTTTTITQALAEIKTIAKRIETKTRSVTEYLMQPATMRDPLEKQGGSAKFIEQERQAIDDLWAQQIRIRRAIEDANIANTITIDESTRPIVEWLIWRREVAPARQLFLRSMAQLISRQRAETRGRGATVVVAGQETKPTDIVVNLNEKALMESLEQLDSTLGQLDGLLSLRNATINIEY